MFLLSSVVSRWWITYFEKQQISIDSSFPIALKSSNDNVNTLSNQFILHTMIETPDTTSNNLLDINNVLHSWIGIFCSV